MIGAFNSNICKKNHSWKLSPIVMRISIIIILLISICCITALVITKRDDNICENEECEKRSNILLEYMNETLNPCDDFYTYVCYNYKKDMLTIPDNETSVNSFMSLRNKVSEQIKSILEEDITENEPRYSKLAKSAYKICMNEEAIEKDSLERLKTYLKDCGGWPVLEDDWNEEKFNWRDTLKKFRNYGFAVSYLFDISVMQDIVNSSQPVIYIDQPTFGINKKFLDKDLNDPYLKAYHFLMKDVAMAFGAKEETADKDLLDVLYFERNLSSIATNEEDIDNIYNSYENSTIGDLNEKYNFTDWDEFFDHVIRSPYNFNSTERIIVEDPNYFGNLSRILNSTNKRVVANFLMWRVVKDSLSYLNKKILYGYEIFERSSYGKNKMSARWKHCVKFIKMNFRIGINAMYVNSYFNKAKKDKVIEMVDNIKDAFKDILYNTTWMDPVTKASAIEKLDALHTHVAYPNELLDKDKVNEVYKEYQDINVTVSYLDLQRQLNLQMYEIVFKRLRTPITKANWTRQVFATEVNAFYSSSDNMIVVPAAILQDVFYNETLPEYVNYASIGLAIAHELTHGFDAKGRQMDKNGNAINWWKSDTAEQYLKKAKCLEDQYSKYFVSQVNLTVNGKNTLDENIADNGGIKETYLAYKKWLNNNNIIEERRLPNLSNYTNDQVFFISTASIWCSKIRNEQLIRDIALNTHTPNQYRVNGMLSNMKEFSEAFKCDKYLPMNPEKKCSLW